MWLTDAPSITEGTVSKDIPFVPCFDPAPLRACFVADTYIHSDSVRAGLIGPLLAFKDGFRNLDSLSDELDRRGAEYESRLSKALDQKELPTAGPLHDRAARTRSWILMLIDHRSMNSPPP